MAVQQIKALGLFHCGAKIRPFTQIPIVQRTLLSVRAGQCCDHLSICFGIRSAKNGNFMSEANQLTCQQPDKRLDTSAGLLADRSGNSGYLRNTHAAGLSLGYRYICRRCPTSMTWITSSLSKIW